VLVDDGVGALVIIDDRPFAVLMFTVADDRIVAIDALRDPERVRRFADAAGIPRSPVTSTAGEGS
jgi:RNA polymerase sigma-70 factor (ECF subfamily)